MMANISSITTFQDVYKRQDMGHRGIMLDVARNFTKKADLLKLIDILSVSYTHLDVYKRQHISPSVFLDMVYFLIIQPIFQSYVLINLSPAYSTINCLLYTSRCV